ncbi:rhomboid protease GluP [Aequitasia blattaphilus]|uniref:Rhomboid family intramembrane serine protease n=1 Tax=Aequitasia blattaphilus TaxID=2949332 RepID=A0ABT1E9E5_9FIRM|nr:rhomboid family intramembrane serine protease [Aequitasia blattaphilus]MCP1102449.1 rhomboid family intramembrane serine protease [Aequitasia blattaphilus]MCR8615089.1 rhomboid family intramembrane serine protease [Aequitasia blattaphilus]
MQKLFKEAPCTAIIAAINIVVFFFLTFQGRTEDAGFLLEHGGMYVPYVFERNEYYRIFTSIFIHAGFNHLVNNMISLFLFGINLEKTIGKVKFIVIYFISGLGANLLSGWFDVVQNEYVVSVGASGAIFGLIGALLYVAIRNRGRIGNISGRGLLIMIVFTLYYGFTSVGVDNIAHLGGLILGFILGVLLYWKRKPRYNEYRSHY